jgi:hypothetical protein
MVTAGRIIMSQLMLLALPNKELSSTTYKQQKLSPSFEALKKSGLKITNYEER